MTGPRYEIVATTRRSWSRAQKRAMVAEIGVGDATLSEVARRHGIHASLLFRWRRDLGGASATTPSGEPSDHGTAAKAGRSVRPALSFVPVVLPPSPEQEPPPQRAEPSSRRCEHASDASVVSTSTIEIVLADGRVLRVGADVDTTALVRIVAALEGHAVGVREDCR